MKKMPNPGSTAHQHPAQFPRCDAVGCSPPIPLLCAHKPTSHSAHTRTRLSATPPFPLLVPCVWLWD